MMVREWFSYWRQWGLMGWVITLTFVSFLVGFPSCALIKYFRDHDVAMDYARDWATRIENVKHVGCVKRDSNYDGYVSCTVYREGVDPLYIECAAALTLEEGCRGRKGE